VLYFNKNNPCIKDIIIYFNNKNNYIDANEIIPFLFIYLIKIQFRKRKEYFYIFNRYKNYNKFKEIISSIFYCLILLLYLFIFF
jgi:hypothetical protein